MSVQITTQEQQIAELICGNTYFDAQANCKSQIKKHNKQIDHLNNEKKQLVHGKAYPYKDRFPISKIPKVVKQCEQEYKQSIIDNAKKEKQELLDKLSLEEFSRKDSKTKSVLFLIISIAVIIGSVIGCFTLDWFVSLIGYIVIGLVFLIGITIGHFRDLISGPRIIQNLKIQLNSPVLKDRLEGKPGTQDKTWANFLADYCNSIDGSREQDIRKDLEQNGGVEEVDNLIAEINNLKKRVHQLESTIKLLDKEEERILTNLKVVPAFYFQEESIKHILVYYVSKRSENITELINMYEQRNKDDSLKDKEKYIQLGLVELNGKLDNAFGRVTNEYDVLTNNAVDTFKLQNVEESSICDFLRIAQHIYNVKEILQTQDATDKEICSTLNDQVPDKIK